MAKTAVHNWQRYILPRTGKKWPKMRLWKRIKNEKPLSRVSPVYFSYSPRRQSRWVLGYVGNDLWKKWVLSLEWNSECVMDIYKLYRLILKWRTVHSLLCYQSYKDSDVNIKHKQNVTHKTVTQVDRDYFGINCFKPNATKILVRQYCIIAARRMIKVRIVRHSRNVISRV